MGILLIKITFFSYFSLIPICGNQDASFGSLDINFVKIVLKALFRYFLFCQSRWYFGILSSNVGIFYHFQTPNTPKLESKRKHERKMQKTKFDGGGYKSRVEGEGAQILGISLAYLYISSLYCLYTK